MKTRRSAGRPSTTGWASIERWTVERLDQAAGMARLEAVPMHERYVTGRLIERLLTKGLEPGMDQISRWNTDRIGVSHVRIATLARRLGFRSDNENSLAENMVFWALRPATKRKRLRVFHATRTARWTAKSLYNAALRKDGGAS